MNSKMFKQNTLQKLDAIYSIKKSMDKWLVLWAEEHCPVQVGDKYPVWVEEDIKIPMVVSKVTAALVPNRHFIWKIEGWVEFSTSKELRTETFEMEENNEK